MRSPSIYLLIYMYLTPIIDGLVIRLVISLYGNLMSACTSNIDVVRLSISGRTFKSSMISVPYVGQGVYVTGNQMPCNLQSICDLISST